MLWSTGTLSCGPSKTLLNKPSLYRQFYGDEPTKKFQSKTKSQIMAFFLSKKNYLASMIF